MNHETQQSKTWWGKFDVEPDQTLIWHIGPLTLAIRRLAQEWQVMYNRAEIMSDDTSNWSLTSSEPPPEQFAHTERFVFTSTAKNLMLTPMLADRSIVTRPSVPFYVPAGQETTIYVSSPLWMKIEAGDPLVTLQEMVIQRPSDTWFGSSTLEGELCYASRTQGRLKLEELPLRPHRAITPVSIRNLKDKPLFIERLNLPVTHLSLFSTSNGTLWTQTVTMIQAKDKDEAVLHIDKSPPSLHAAQATFVNGPRERLEKP